MNYRSFMPTAGRIPHKTWGEVAISLVKQLIQTASKISLDPKLPQPNLPTPPFYGDLILDIDSPKMRRNLIQTFPKLETTLDNPDPLSLRGILLAAEFCFDLGLWNHHRS